MLIQSTVKGINRQHVRLQLTGGLPADLLLREVRGKPVLTKSRKVLLRNLSPGGACMMTFLDFPVTLNYIIQLRIEAAYAPLELVGQIVWKRKQENSYEYGISFTMTPSERTPLLYLLNHLLLQECPSQAKIHNMYQRFNTVYKSTGRCLI